MGSLLLLLLATGAAVLSLVSLSKAGLCAPTTSSFRHREEKERSAGENWRGGGCRLILTWANRTAEAIRQLEKLKLTTHFIVITGWCN